MRHNEIAGLMTALAPVVGDFVSKAVAPLRAQNDALLGRLDAIEQRFASYPSNEDNSVPILRLVQDEVAKIQPAQPKQIDLAALDLAVTEKVACAVAQLPEPTPGKDADPELVARLVEDAVAKVQPVPGRDGKDADPALIADLVDKAVAALPVAKDGEPGPAGESVRVEDLSPLVAETVAKALADELEKIAANLPAGKDGAPGEPGKSVTVDDLAPLVDDLVSKRVAELPSVKDGKDGAPGRDGRDGLPGVQGERGTDGRHGVDGKDGLGIDDFDVQSADDGRTLEFSLKRHEADPIVKLVRTSVVLDRGVWREKPEGFAKGDGVTWGGSFFIAQRDTTDKPETSDAWRLSVKRGRDGKEGKSGQQGERGMKGDPGVPGRNGF